MNPWWAEGTFQFVKNRLDKNSIVFEWGSGSSTECIAKTCNIISIENDAEWYKKLKSKNIKNVDLRLITDSGPSNNNPDDPYGYTSNSKYFNKLDFTKYVKEIDKFEKFDLVIIDGRARTSCIAHAINHIEIGGMLLLDDYWREHYKNGMKLIPQKWKSFEFKSPEHCTKIWINCQ